MFSSLVVMILLLMANSAVAGDEAPAARRVHDYLAVTIELARDDAAAGDGVIDYSHRNDPAVLRKLSGRLMAMDTATLNQLATSWRDVGTASWVSIVDAVERCVDSILDGGRVFVESDAIRTALFIPLDAGLTPGLRDTVLCGGGRSKFGRLRSFIVIGENPMTRPWIDTWTYTRLNTPSTARDYMGDAIIAVIAAATEARVANHRASIRRVRAKRD